MYLGVDPGSPLLSPGYHRWHAISQRTLADANRPRACGHTCESSSVQDLATFQEQQNDFEKKRMFTVYKKNLPPPPKKKKIINASHDSTLSYSSLVWETFSSMYISMGRTDAFSPTAFRRPNLSPPLPVTSWGRCRLFVSGWVDWAWHG